MAVVGGLTVARDGDQRTLTPVASVQDLGERAAKAAETDPYKITPSPGQWLYVEQTIAPIRDEPRAHGVDLDKRITLETWNSVDGKQTALDDGKGKLVVHNAGPGITGADLAKAPVTPEEMLTRIEVAISKDPASLGVASDDTVKAPKEQRVFEAIFHLMNNQALVPDVRAALFRALSTIKGVTVKKDAVDAAGRHGIAFVYTGAWERFEIILSGDDYRFLGTYGETVADRTFSVPQIVTNNVKAGTPVVWSAMLATKAVDRPGDRP